jgi:hypothetical protein
MLLFKIILAIHALSITFATIGTGIVLLMDEKTDILGWVKPIVERRWTPDSWQYKLTYCAKCVSGQICFWSCLTLSVLLSFTSTPIEQKILAFLLIPAATLQTVFYAAKIGKFE